MFQFLVLYFKDITFQPLWLLIETMQLAAFLPLYDFTFIPYMYEAVRPFHVAHMILTNKAYVLTDMEQDYFGNNYRHASLNVAKLGQGLFC